MRKLLPLVFYLCALSYLAEEVVVVNYGGAYARAVKDGFESGFVAETGIEVKNEDYTGGLAQIRAQVEVGSVHWDIVYMDSQDVVTGCDEGLLAPLDEIEFADGPDGTPAREDFEPSVVHECAIGSLFYATVITYNPLSFPGEKPASVRDFFNLESFPGRRALRRMPAFTLELALLGDGVPPDEIYDLMSTEEGIKRAYAKLDTIKDQVIWWETGAQPPQLLADQEVSMAQAWNGRIFNAQVREKQPFIIIWNGQIFDDGKIAIVEGAPNYANAVRYVQGALRAESMAGVANHIAYSPTRKSAYPLIGDHIPTGEPMIPHLPTNPENLKNALTFDPEWWVDNGDEQIERFSAWLAQ